MPCISERDNYDEIEDLNERITKLREDKDFLTRLLCDLCNKIENQSLEHMYLLSDTELREWWFKHKKWDAKRKADLEAKFLEARRVELEKHMLEERKRAALNKLTPEERELLGLWKLELL